MVLTPDESQNLRKHKFVGTDNSILSKYVIRHYTAWLVEKVPLGVAPNMLTLWGLVAMGASLALTLAFDPHLNNAPRFLPLANLLLMFVYFTCDNLDGAQARRTGSGSPLGQLFDHGVDSCCALVSSIALSSTFGFGLSQAFVALTLAIMAQFYLVGVEEKLTGHFVLGRVSGASEGIALALASHLVSFVCGRSAFGHLFSDAFLRPVKQLCCWVPGFGNLRPVSMIIVAALAFNTASVFVSIESKASPAKRLVLYSTFVRIASFGVSFVIMFNTLHASSVWIQYLNILMFGQVFSIKYISEVYSYIIKKDTFLFMPVYLMYLALSGALQLQHLWEHRKVLVCASFCLSSAYYILVVSRMIVTLTEALGIRFLSIAKEDPKGRARE